MATASLLALFRVLAPEFAATADGTVDALLDEVTLQVNSGTFGALTSQAIVSLTAHEFTLQARDAAASAGFSGVGGVTSQRAGDLAVSFGGAMNTGSGDDYYRQTRHGLAYLRIRDSRSQPLGVLT